MRTVVVAGARGGIGKTVLATHLAAHAALAGRYTALLDADPAGLATRWARRRAELRSAVLPLSAGPRADWVQHLPYDTDHLVVDVRLDQPADRFEPMFELAQAVVVPVPTCEERLQATASFLALLADVPRVRRGELRVALVSRAPEPPVMRWAATGAGAACFATIPGLRYSRAYVLMCALGRSLFDYQSESVRAYRDDWTPLLEWLDA